jgi:hypothetical protein
MAAIKKFPKLKKVDHLKKPKKGTKADVLLIYAPDFLYKVADA